MERKSMGSFIAALRKANGMTQKQLAEKLNVSDKAVSRWECDESAPDLSLIPVIAEIFNITSDELLKGQRINPEASEKNTSNEKSEKQINRLLKKVKTKFRIKSVISVGIGFVGLIGAMICNFGFNRAYIGFFISGIFYLTAVICQIAFIIQALASVSNDEIDDTKLSACQKYLVNDFQISIFSVISIFAATLPLVTVAYDAYVGITASYWFKTGLVYFIISVVLCAVLSLIINSFTEKSATDTLSEKELEKKQKQKKIRNKYIISAVIILTVTLIGQGAFNAFVTPAVLASGTSFNNIEEFKKYIEMPTDIDTGIEMISEYYDENGNEISKEQFYKEYIYDQNGKVICEYLHKNENVTEISYKWKDGNIISITTYTADEISSAYKAIEAINLIWLILYLAEILIIALLCRKKQKAIK